MPEVRRQRLWQLGAAGLFAAIVVAAAIVVSQAGSTALQHLPADRRAVARLFGGVAQRGQVLGAKDAPTTLVEFADLQCPFCRQFALDSLPAIIERYVKPGRLRLRFEPQTFIGSESSPNDSEAAARFALAASLQNRLWQLVEVFYRNQDEENSGYVTDSFLRSLGEATPGLDVKRAFGARDAPRIDGLLKAGAGRFSSFGLDSTPSFVLEEPGRPPQTLDIANAGDPSEFTTALDAIPQAAGR